MLLLHRILLGYQRRIITQCDTFEMTKRTYIVNVTDTETVLSRVGRLSNSSYNACYVLIYTFMLFNAWLSATEKKNEIVSFFFQDAM